MRAKSDYNFWKNQWGDNVWMSYGTNTSAGVAILRGQFSSILKSKAHEFGKWLVLALEKRDNVFIWVIFMLQIVCRIEH